MANILIVDDEETLLATLSLELGRMGHKCLPANSAEAALTQLESGEPHIALVDIRLPDTDGLKLIEQIRQIGHDFPIVVMTAYGSVQSAVHAMKVGASDYLQKPVAIDELEVVIDRVLQNTVLSSLAVRCELFVVLPELVDLDLSSPDDSGQVLIVAQRAAP